VCDREITTHPAPLLLVQTDVSTSLSYDLSAHVPAHAHCSTSPTHAGN